jgi:hypothetical protein
LEGERAGASLSRDGNGWPQNGIHLPEVCHVDAGLLRAAALKLDLVHSMTGTISGTTVATSETAEQQTA